MTAKSYLGLKGIDVSWRHLKTKSSSGDMQQNPPD